MTSKLIDHAAPVQRAVVIHPDGRSESSRLAQERLDEASGLARALDLDIRAEEIVRMRKVAPATLFGSGKVDELAALIRAAEAAARGRPALAGLDLRIDMVTLAPGRFPRHLRGVISTGADRR